VRVENQQYIHYSKGSLVLYALRDAIERRLPITASVWQARQPVYARSVGRWKSYAPYLPELATLAG